MKDDDRPGSGDLGWHYQFGNPRGHLTIRQQARLVAWRGLLQDQPDLDDQRVPPDEPAFAPPPVTPPTPTPVTLDQAEPQPSPEPLED